MAERQRSLELELQATKNTVIVLSKRVRTLEIEFTRLKSLLKRSVLLPPGDPEFPTASSQNGITVFSSDGTGTVSGIKAQTPEPNVISISDSSDEEEADTVEVAVPDPIETPPVLISQQTVEDSDINDDRSAITILEIPTHESVDDMGDDSLEGKIRIKSPMKLLDQFNTACPTTTNAIWSNFIQTEVVSKGKKSVAMLCKFCKGVVNARIDLLRQHLNECPQFEAGSKIAEEASSTENKMETEDKPGTSIPSVAKPKGRKAHGGGRKKLPVWKHFITKPREKANGRNRRPTTAFCKVCNQDVSAKVQRLQAHLAVCPGKPAKSKLLVK